MLSKLMTVINIVWLKLRHPGVKTKGVHHIRMGTEITLHSNGKLCVGRRVSTHKRDTLSVFGGTLTIGDDTSFNRNNIIVCQDSIQIADHCMFGPNVSIFDHDHIFDSKGISRSQFKKAPIIIDSNCWIGANVTILRGTHIGEGCVIGAGMVVKGEIPPHSLVVSNNRNMIIKQIR